MAKRSGLGRGLDALFSSSKTSVASIIDNITSSHKHEDSNLVPNSGQLYSIPLGEIIANRYQPRKVFDQTKLQELSDSIIQNGVIQPIVVRKLSDNNDSKVPYELIAGERRWRASKLASLTHIPAIIREFSDEQALAVALIENLQRHDLNVIEEAKSYKRLIDEFALTHENLSKVTGRSRSHITNIIRLLNLHLDVQDMLSNESISMGHARALLVLPHELQKTLAKEIVEKSFTTSFVEAKVKKILDGFKENKTQSTAIDTNNTPSDLVDNEIGKIKNMVAKRLGKNVHIRHGVNGQGKITIRYSSLEELNNLVQLL